MLPRLRTMPAEARMTALVAVIWVTQPFALGPLLADALDPTAEGFRTVATVGAWTWWLCALVALALPRPLTLTIARIAVPASTPAALWATLETGDAVVATAGLAAAALATVTVLLPGIGDRFIDGAGYGDERRFMLRPPGPVLVGGLVPTWAATVAGLVAGPLLLADRHWVTGALATTVGVPIALIGMLALLRLTGRFLVFVPNGLVVHDRAVLREPVLFVRGEILGLGPAPADTTALDLTAGALGLALEVRLERPAKVPLVTGRGRTEETEARAVLVSPTRPAAVLHTARDRGLPIG